MNVTSPGAKNWTDQQHAAIDSRNVSVALSAGAGCGKTFVLTERFLANFDPDDSSSLRPDELGRLVAITFTERAAREMRDRIRQKCRERLAHAQAGAARYWSELLLNLDNARISTIHAFCASLLRSHAAEAGVDPRFEVLEQAQADALLSESIDDCLRRRIAGQDADALALAALFDVPRLRELLRGIVLQCYGAEQLQTVLRRTPEEQVQIWAKHYKECVVPDLCRQLAECPAAREVLDILTHESPDHPVMKARRAVLLETLRSLADGKVAAEKFKPALAEVHKNARVQGGGTARNWRSAEVYASFREAAEALRKAIDRLASITGFDAKAALQAAIVGRQLLGLAADVQQAYTARKQAITSFDFNDLLSLARSLLVDPSHESLRARLRSQIHLLLVDEFQDTDRLQLGLVHALCGEASASQRLFIVGDYKQSIYRFRGADPDVFLEVRRETPAAGKLSLTRNFRSQPAILEFVNALFWDDLGPDYEPLRAEREQVSPVPAVEFMWAPMEDAKEPASKFRAREADWIARRIQALLDSESPLVWDAEAADLGQPAARVAQPGDIAILFRALSDVQYYENALQRHGIDYYLVGGRAFYAQQEIFDLLNLLRTLNSLCDEVSLLGALRSAFFSLTDETIFWLAQHPGGLNAGLFAESYPADIPAGQQAQARFAASTIEFLRENKDRMRICELIERALEMTGYDATLLNEFLGQRKLANVRKVVQDARDFERPGLFSLGDFIGQLSDFVASKPEEPLAATHSENANVVRLMTIHQAKGLEFPIVIVPDLDRPTKNDSDGAALDSELGLCVKLPEDNDAERPPGGYELWQFRERDRELAELYRLLYVATTRAADYLLLSSSVRESGRGKGAWMELLSRRFDLDSGKCLAPLPPEEAVPRVRVTRQEPPDGKTRAKKKRVDIEKVLDEALQVDPADCPRLPGLDAIPPDPQARRQFSFSRLQGTLHRRFVGVSSGDGTDPEPLDSLGLGTLAHAVLAAIDFAKPQDPRALVELCAARQSLAGSLESAEVLEMVTRFMASPRASHLAGVKESYPELEFLLAWPPEGSAARPVILGGYIDRLYQDTAGDWHIVDFKTNRVPAGELAKQAAGYEMQMLVYALAAEQILKSSPRTLTLHFLRTGEEYAFAWDDAARARVVELVNRGIVQASAEVAAAAS